MYIDVNKTRILFKYLISSIDSYSTSDATWFDMYVQYCVRVHTLAYIGCKRMQSLPKLLTLVWAPLTMIFFSWKEKGKNC